MKFQTGEFGRRLLIMKKRVMRKNKGKLLAGRQMLWMLYNYFRTNKNLGHIHSIVDLAKVEWRGDGHIEAFRNDWENLVEGLPYRTSRTYMAELLLDQMTKSTVLKSKVDKYKKRYPGRTKSYSKLLGIIDRYLHDKQEVENRKKLESEQARRNKHAVVPVKASNCQFWMRGACDKGKDCPNLHESSLKGKISNPVMPSTPPKGKSKGKSKRKSKSRSPSARRSKGKGKPRSKGPGGGKSGSSMGKGKGQPQRRMLCAWFQTGSCTVQNCPFLHQKASTPEQSKQLERFRSKPSSRSPSPSGTKRPCYSWLNKGSCEHGASCQFAHDPSKRGKGKSPAAPATKSMGKGKGRPRSSSRARSTPPSR